MKLCTECRFFTPPHAGQDVKEWARCTALIGAQSPVDGQRATGGFCSSARMPHGPCGPDGKHHEATAAEVPAWPCPKCHSTDTDNACGDAAGIETHYQLCYACGHQWGHS